MNKSLPTNFQLPACRCRALPSKRGAPPCRAHSTRVRSRGPARGCLWRTAQETACCRRPERASRGLTWLPLAGPYLKLYAGVGHEATSSPRVGAISNQLRGRQAQPRPPLDRTQRTLRSTAPHGLGGVGCRRVGGGGVFLVATAFPVRRNEHCAALRSTAPHGLGVVGVRVVEGRAWW